MEILLDDFEHQIDETILERGFDYFEKGYVTDVTAVGDGMYEITVEGSDTYTVRLNIQGNIVTELECDCPYDWGPICKHMVAALFYLQKSILGPMELSAKKTSNKRKEKSVTAQAETLLGALPHEALKAFMHEVCMNDRKFCQLFVAKHIHLLYPESKELYSRQLQTLIKVYSDKDGFVNYRDASRLGSIVSEMAVDAMADLEEGKIRKSLFIAWAIIEEMAIMVNYKADDSDGQIGGSIEEAFAVLEALTELNLNKRLHNELFDCMLSLFENDSLKDWDWHFTSMYLAIQLVKTNQEKEKIKSALDKIKPNGKSWDFDYEKAQELMLELIKKTESPETATRFIENNLSNPKFRVELIEKALQAKDYQKVERLASEGVVKDEKEAPGRADDWRNYLLTLYQQTGDVKHVIELARYFLLHSNGRHQPLKYYYDLLKSLVPQDQWEDYLSNLINDINNKSPWIDYDRLSQLYIWDSQWDKLFELLRQNASFDRLGNAEKYIADSYRDELAALYRKLILAYLERHMGRPHYQTVCRYIQRMIEFGAGPMARNLIRELKTLYSNRGALIDELDKI